MATEPSEEAEAKERPNSWGAHDTELTIVTVNSSYLRKWSEKYREIFEVL